MIPASRWIRVDGAQIPAREGRALRVGDRELALFNLGDRFLAVDGRCPHQGGPLCDGIVSGETVICPLHAWKINLRSGAVERPQAASNCVQTYPTAIVDGLLTIELPEDASSRKNRVDGDAVARPESSGHQSSFSSRGESGGSSAVPAEP